MKIFRNYKFLVVGIVFLLSLSIIGLWQYDSSYKFMKNEHNKMVSRCEKIDRDTSAKNDIDCEKILSEDGPVKLDAYSLTFYIINETVFFCFLPIIPLIIIALSFEKLYKYIKSVKKGKYDLKKILAYVFRYSLIIPAIVIFIFIISLIYSKSLTLNLSNIPTMYFNNIVVLTVFYLLNLALNSAFWIGLTLLVINKQRKPMIVISLAYIIYLLYITIVGVGSRYISNLNISSYVRLGSIWGYDGINNILLMTLYSIFLVFIVLSIAYIKYNRKKVK